jgi:hypothetical protein
MEIGKKLWVFADGDLPPHGQEEPYGHEALMVVNNGEKEAHLAIEVLFEDREPVSGIELKVPAKRVNCFRMDYPVGKQAFEVPFGQYAIVVTSDVPVVAVFGRLDRRKDMAYYPVAPYCE